MKKIGIIGGGIIGLCTAYYLEKEGYQVVVFDQSNMDAGASYVNAGYITPSHIIPLAAPGMISKGIKWMFDASSPFYIKPRLEKDFIRWSWAFKKSATAAKVARAIPAIKDINVLSRELYKALKDSGDFDFHYQHKGLLMCYKTDKAGEEEWEVGQKAIAQGLHVKLLTKAEVDEIEPHAKLDIKGAVYFDSDAHMTPSNFMENMKAYLLSKGVEIHQQTKITDLKLSQNKITHLMSGQTSHAVDEVVLTAGSWSPILAKKLGLHLLIQAGKGYRINTTQDTGIQIPAILVESKVAVTPMQGYTRFAGTMELGGINHDINPVRVNAIAKAASDFYNGLSLSEAEKEDAQCGLRPVTPDGMPYIGRSSKCNNLCIATGHAMMGWSLGPVTGRLVSEIISDKKPSLNLDLYHPDRKF